VRHKKSVLGVVTVMVVMAMTILSMTAIPASAQPTYYYAITGAGISLPLGCNTCHTVAPSLNSFGQKFGADPLHSSDPVGTYLRLTGTTTAPPPATATAVPPTATPKPANTPVPPTATPKPANTPVPPTATAVPPTATAKPANTPVPPIATATPAPTTCGDEEDCQPAGGGTGTGGGED
jgi:hypothetical protein